MARVIPRALVLFVLACTPADDVTSDAGSTSIDTSTCDDPDDSASPSGIDELPAQLCNGQLGNFSGILNGEDDADFYKFRTEKIGSCGSITVETASSQEIEICAAATCDIFADAFVTCQGSQQATDLIPGCCITGKRLDLTFGCSADVDQAWITIRLRTDADACIDYDMTYLYH